MSQRRLGIGVHLFDEFRVDALVEVLDEGGDGVGERGVEQALPGLPEAFDVLVVGAGDVDRVAADGHGLGGGDRAGQVVGDRAAAFVAARPPDPQLLEADRNVFAAALVELGQGLLDALDGERVGGEVSHQNLHQDRLTPTRAPAPGASCHTSRAEPLPSSWICTMWAYIWMAWFRVSVLLRPVCSAAALRASTDRAVKFTVTLVRGPSAFAASITTCGTSSGVVRSG